MVDTKDRFELYSIASSLGILGGAFLMFWLTGILPFAELGSAMPLVLLLVLLGIPAAGCISLSFQIIEGEHITKGPVIAIVLGFLAAIISAVLLESALLVVPLIAALVLAILIGKKGNPEVWRAQRGRDGAPRKRKEDVISLDF